MELKELKELREFLAEPSGKAERKTLLMRVFLLYHDKGFSAESHLSYNFF